MPSTRHLLAFLLSLAVAVCQAADSPAKVDADHAERAREGRELFESTVREIFVKHCLDCHGGKSTKANFNLATRKALMESEFVGKAADESYLMELIRHESEPVMPFKADKLSDQQIAAIARWINLGAPYDKPLIDAADAKTDQPMQVTDADRQFWSFAPLSKAQPPASDDDAWSRTTVDRFIHTRLADAKIAANPVADRRTLIRRATLDLIGLPPRIEDVTDFVNDPEPDDQAFEKVIDRLLQSVHYAERWARHWMDVARFAESMGFEHDYNRSSAYHYRDFLIRAFNSDMPWDQMVRWQLAGDEIAPEQPLAWMATGFLGAGVFPTQLTEAEFESARYDELDDVVGTTGVAFLGLSVGCARCHDHKFDPIPTRDYYALVATFATTIRSEREIEFNRDQYQAKLETWQDKHSQLTTALKKFEAEELEPRFDRWLSEPTVPDDSNAGKWQVLSPESVQSRDGATLSRQADGSWLASGKNPKNDEYTIVVDVSAGASALRIEALTHDSMPRKGPGRANNGNFALGNLTVESLPTDAKANAKPTPVKLVHPRATHQQNTGGLSVASSIDGDINSSGWAVDVGGIGKDQAAIFEFERPLAGKSRLMIKMRFHVNTSHALGRFRLSTSNDASSDFELGKGLPADLARALALVREDAIEKLTDAQRKALQDWYASRDADWLKLKRSVDAHAASKPKPDTRKVLVCSEGVKPIKHHADGRGYPHFYPDVHLLDRGDPKQKQEVMDAGALKVVGGELPKVLTTSATTGGVSYRRTRLANWMTDHESGAGHLLARVIVNRLWQHHCGRGIVATPNDFGFQGDRPTHPELLDWLAKQLIDGGWKLKPIHKLIMTSSVYMQSSDADESRTQADIDNLLWWRYQPRRLEAEAIRDSLLFVSGQLDATMYGPGTLSESMRRRSVYFTIKRSQFIPMMQIFDWPEHLVSIGRRSDTAIAPQALALMNGPEVRKYAQSLADRAGKVSDSQEGSIVAAYQIVLSRQPSSDELAAASAFINAQAGRYGDAANGDMMAMVDFCQALFCSNEFLYLP